MEQGAILYRNSQIRVEVIKVGIYTDQRLMNSTNCRVNNKQIVNTIEFYCSNNHLRVSL